MNWKSIIFVVIAVVILGGLFFVLKPGKQATDNGPKVFEIVVQDKKVVSGPDSLKVNEGDQVVIKITVNEAEELHLHGYDRSIDLEPNVQGELSFTANLSGRFVYELENSKTELGALEVQPK